MGMPGGQSSSWTRSPTLLGVLGGRVPPKPPCCSIILIPSVVANKTVPRVCCVSVPPWWDGEGLLGVSPRHCCP